ncbi:S-adenosylmethionine decarboxylase [Rickenella mellea]|uniref:S-adenosylmethionine decarboxylase n=1 Tax=Rickenella mellea TaxID=50990 RepID=A0A4Y7Q9R9_9AGAM|nr:S-adenosylmethionine decarboxylase [Rickenella mellea]
MAYDVEACPFEGPEKLLEIWFAPSPDNVPDATSAKEGRSGLRAIDRHIWEDMLDIVKCKVLSVVNGKEIDAYLLSESSLFISPHRLILKTCGTTLNLLGLPRILDIARTHAKLPNVYRCFYSRKSFMFPERQMGPHKEWSTEVKFLDDIFDNGAAYAVGKVNGDHWLLYITSPSSGAAGFETVPSSPTPSFSSDEEDEPVVDGPYRTIHPLSPPIQDYTIEILMTNLSAHARSAFFNSNDESASEPGKQAQLLSNEFGISDIFPRHLTQLDAYSFQPCGYSSNALLSWGGEKGGEAGEGYYTIHVTPEEGWSYASFECNVPLPTKKLPDDGADAGKRNIPDLQTLIQRVVRIFEPGKITLTLFVSSEDNSNAEEESGETAVDVAQRAFKAALVIPPLSLKNRTANPQLPNVSTSDSDVRGYRRTDKINYEFGGYDLAFASFERVT